MVEGSGGFRGKGMTHVEKKMEGRGGVGWEWPVLASGRRGWQAVLEWGRVDSGWRGLRATGDVSRIEGSLDNWRSLVVSGGAMQMKAGCGRKGTRGLERSVLWPAEVGVTERLSLLVWFRPGLSCWEEGVCK